MSDIYRSLHSAAANGNLAAIEELILNGFDVNALWSEGTFLNVTPLSSAARYGQCAAMESLIANGASVNNKSSPLHDAASRGHAAAIQVLVNNGADVNAVDRDNCTSLHLAALLGSNDVIALLIAEGANASVANSDGKTPHALYKGNDSRILGYLVTDSEVQLSGDQLWLTLLL